MKDKMRNWIFGLIVVVVIVVVVLLNSGSDGNGNYDEEVMKCLSEKSVLYVSKTCGHCAGQKLILGEYLDLFKVVDCTDEPEVCALNEINYVPTWEIDNQKYVGKKTIQELKDFAGC